MRLLGALAIVLVLVVVPGCGGGDDDGGEAARTATGESRPPSPDHADRARRAGAEREREQRSAAERRRARSARRRAPLRSSGGPRVETIATGLDVPWEIAFLPDRRALVSERGGTVRILSARRRLLAPPAGRLNVAAVGEGGLLGLAVDPAFEDNRFVYAYRTAAGGNEVLRLRLTRRGLRRDATLVEGIASSAIHDGGRLRIGPDRHLYVTTGDASQPQLAQQDGLNGKILRLAPEEYRGSGGRPEVVSTGHRNVQGVAWQPRSRRLFATEHGPTGNDELNLIRRGGNYGWPEVQGRDHGSFRAPVAVYAQSVAPSGATFVTLPGSAWTGDLLFGCLVGEQIRRVSFDGARVRRNEALFAGRFGRIRTVVEGPDGALYALTNNTDGRGRPRAGDDRILRIVPPRG